MTLSFALNFIWSAAWPALTLIFPGIYLTRGWSKRPAVALGEMFLWSAGINIVGLFVAAAVGINSLWYLLAVAAASIALCVRHCLAPWRWPNKSLWLAIALALVTYMFFGVLFVIYDQGLPTGDSQKAIYWAEQINATNSLPNYQSSIANLNRDPVDFYTPGLHVWTALLMKYSILPLTTIGWLAIAGALAVAFVGAALAEVIGVKKLAPQLLAMFLILTHYRFLRYVNEPGYHLQNLVGELLLFGLVLATLRLIQKWQWRRVVLGGLLAVAIFVSHQFSAFIGAFVLAPALLILAARYFNVLPWRRVLPLAVAGIIALLGLAYYLGILSKAKHLFSAAPHLTSLVPSWQAYFSLMGTPWFTLTLAAIVSVMLLAFRHWRTELTKLYLAIAAIVILALSQGPHWHLDIPPVRALFYLIVLGSVLAACFIAYVWRACKPITLRALIVLLIILFGFNSAAAAYSFSHDTRTDSALTPELHAANEQLRQHQKAGGILTDDYNRRAASWLILSGHPSYTRLASDISTLMAETSQTPLRYQMYLKQLDFEKIFSLGSRPDIIKLMRRHNLEWIAGSSNSSNAAFASNPALKGEPVSSTVTLWQKNDMGEDILPPQRVAWLLKPSTLANDIGDDEDVFEHLPASLRAARLSDPRHDTAGTWRGTTAPLIPLKFNVGNYAAPLWHATASASIDNKLTLWLLFKKRPADLSVRASSGQVLPVPADGWLEIPAGSTSLDDDGFVTLILQNPAEASIEIDLIALGLASTT